MSVPTRSRLFSAAVQHQPLCALFLIENSVAMSRVWPDLKDQALTKLLHTLIATNPTAPHIAVSFLESCPEEGHSSHPFLPRQYSDPFAGLENIRFSYAPENRISPGLVDNCIHFLESSNFQGQSMSVHLFIVASTAPSRDTAGTPFPNNGYSPWAVLAQKMAQANIHCHLVLSPQEDLSELSLLFEEAVRLRGNVEEPAPFPSDPTRVLCRLSSRSPFETYGSAAASGSGMPVQQPDRIAPPRRNSFPLDNFYPDGHTPTQGGELDPPPSLVSQLQQVHGLTKKKVYGTKPPRPPFFKDEPVRENQRLPVRDRYRGKGPAQLTMPPTLMETIESSNSGGRAMSQSRADRKNRVGQSSPVDSSRRQLGWPRRLSGLSTPEPDALPSSATTYADTSPGGSYISSDFSSPVTPASTADEYYGVATQGPVNTGPPNMAPSSQPVYSNLPTPDVQWSQSLQYGSPYSSVPGPAAPSYFTNPGNQQYVGSFSPQVSNGHFDNYVGEVPPATVMSRAPQAPAAAQTPPVPQTHSNPAPPTQVPVPFTTSNTKPSHHRTSSNSKKNDDDDERFVFTKEFVAATATMFEEEVLPAYPNYPGASSGLFSNGVQPNLPSTLPASQVGELYASRNRLQALPEPPVHSNSNIHPLANVHAVGYSQPRSQISAAPLSQVPSSESYSSDQSYQNNYGSSASTSSLVGWAG
ncbi:hypothetical protein CVT24_004433 [Panaeolus cyanescens]|uniref:Mediator of RNA polymerase II transcription subunit 25 n=1 Tax=Panaeolus cyanescens TaxID=181874 RepID=A0A409VCB0_9AGAR|nr:hypothetical protein CVT24_004433 [Panaeolus cyanescens]